MLRIESYVTPIILSYVDKYIKNLKPEDSQVSLWGGDAVFNNLDLRLDVLEQELKLPFSFVNGHIHELRIHVPWTKLISEPIVITINTIECILKLKDYDGSDSDSTSQADSLEGKSFECYKKRQKRPEIEAPTSYIQGLISRVINNVSIVCNNVILKYVEDDIVLSINAKTLELKSVDNKWTPAFIDLSPDDTMLRNLASLTDLTVCLDKRNASGKIESYQEPLLYRCSLSCRIIRHFESVYSYQPISTRYDVFCPQLHFSLSDTQLPMFMRLLELVLALYFKQLQYQPPKDQSKTIVDKSIGDLGDEKAHFEGDASGDDSWSSWMWSIGSSLLPVGWDEGEESAQSIRHHKLNNALHLGIYVEIATWVFKLTESVQDASYFGPSKMHFTPFMKIEQQGSYVSVVSKGLEAVNVQLGISSILVDPVSNCICGIADSNEDSAEECSSDNKTCCNFIHSGRESQEYLAKSLFDERILLGGREMWDYQYIWENHLISETECTLLEKTSAVGIDYLYIMDLPSDISSEKLSEIDMHPEDSNFKERALCRIVLGPFEVNMCSGFYHRLSAVQFALDQYDYSPYCPKVNEMISLPITQLSEEEINLLESNIPLRTFTLTCIEPCLKVYYGQHPSIDMKTVFNAKRRIKNKKVSSDFCMATVMPVPALTFKIGRLEVEYSKVMYPERLVATASILRPPNANLLHNCHTHLTVKIHLLSINLEDERRRSVSLLQGFSPAFYMKTLLLPHQWSSLNQPRIECFLESDQLSISASLPQIMLIHHLLSSWLDKIPSPEVLYTHSLVSDAVKHSDKFPVLNFKMNYFESKICQTPALHAGMATIGSVSAALCQSNLDIICYLMSGPETSTGIETTELYSASEKFIKVSIQMPVDNSDNSVPTILSIRIQKMSYLIDPQLICWLKYFPKFLSGLEMKNAVFFQRISDVKLMNVSKPSECDGSETLKPESSSTTVSEVRTTSRVGFFGRQDTSEFESKSTLKDKFMELYPLISNLLIFIEIDAPTIFMSSSAHNILSDSGLINAIHRIYLTRGDKTTLKDTTVICLPKLLLQNSAQKQPFLSQIHDVPIILPNSVWTSDKDKLPWSLGFTNFHIYSLQGYGESVKLSILNPVNTTATLSVTPKYQGPILSQVGTVIHIDMSPVDLCASKRQIEAHVAIAEGFLSLLDLFRSSKDSRTAVSIANPAIPLCQVQSKPSLVAERLGQTFQSKNKKLNIKIQTDSPSNCPPSKIREQEIKLNASANAPSSTGQSNIVPKLTNSDPANTAILTEAEDVEDTKVQQTFIDPEVTTNASETSVLLTSWVQWTVARVSTTLYAHSGHKPLKLRAEIEDLTMSIDLHEVYCKVKCKIANFSILHFVKSANDWCIGEHEGVIVTGGDQITKDLKLVNVSSKTSEAATKSVNTGVCSDQRKTNGFLTFTFTMAQCKSIHSKWNQVVRKHFREERFIKECNSPRFLSEVDIRLQPFDLVFFPATIQPFLSIYEPWLLLLYPKAVIQTATNSRRTTPIGMAINNKALPLMYLQTENIRLFLPSNKSNSEESNAPNFILIQLDSILVSPQVDNPLSRIILRPDIFNAAEQARILGVPGSEVEDRQYQVDFVGFSICTGSWFDMERIKQGRPRSFSAGILGENPALEWNNYDPSKENSEPEVIMYPLIARLDTKIIAAPAIVYLAANEEKGSLEEAILVAGHSLEINATSEIDIFSSLTQISLMKEVISDIISCIMETKKSCTKCYPSSKSSEILDSGVDCDMSSIDLSKTGFKGQLHKEEAEGNILKFVPLEVLITGSKITFNIFEKCLVEGKKLSLKGCQRTKLEHRAKIREKQLAIEVASTESEPSPLRYRSVKPCPPENLKHSSARSTSHIIEMEDGYDGSEEESTYEPQNHSNEPQLRFLPLVYVSVSQPHTFITCQPLQQKVDISCFDFVMKSVSKGFSIKASDSSKNLPNQDDYTISWFETRPGEPHPKTGIPPALLNASIYDFLHKPARLSIDIGRPFRVSLSQSKWDQVQHVFDKLYEFIPQSDDQCKVNMDQSHRPDLITSSVSVSEEYFTEKLKRYSSHVDAVSLSTNQICFNIEVTKDAKAKSEVTSSISGLNFSLLVSRKKQNSDLGIESISEISCKVNVNDVQLKTMFHNMEMHSFLKPWTVSSEIKFAWLLWSPSPYIEFKIQSEISHIELGPENIFCLCDIFEYLKIFIKQFDSKNNSMDLNQKIALSTSIDEELYSDLFFQDDLRAGAFQYVSYPSASTKEIFPLPYQVVFDKALGIMVWCYPEPRALIRVDVYPVPFIAASEISSVSNETQEADLVLCALQYYDTMRESFVTYQKFHLSESKLCQLDLPGMFEKRLLAVSTTWRVCIDYKEEDFDELLKAKSFVSPEALAACIRVDSLFSVEILPKIQTVLTLRKVDILLVNHRNLTGSKLSPELKSFSLDESIPKNQPFMSVTLDNLCMRTYSWASGDHIDVGGTFYIYVLNYKFLTNHIFLEPASLQASVSVQKTENNDKPKCYDISVISKSMYIHVNQSSVSTLATAHKMWQQAFVIVENISKGPNQCIKKALPAILMSNYILTNNSTDSIRFGQVNSDENSLLEPGAIHLYSWRSHKLPPVLQVCIESMKWKWSDPISLEKEGSQMCSMSHSSDPSLKFLVTCKKISSRQIQVTFSGVLTIANYLSEDIEFRVMDKSQKDESPKQLHVYSLKSLSVSPSVIKDPHSIKVRISGGQTWSGEIPFSYELSKDSFIVKVPMKNKKESIPSLCKVYRERVGATWRLLVLFSPQFMVRSHLPRPLTLHITTPSTNITQKSIVKGRGRSQALHCDPSLTHHLTFQLSSDLKVSKPPIPITKAMVEQVRQSTSEESVDIPAMLEKMFLGPNEKWPYIDSSFIEGDFLFADQPKIDLQIGFNSLFPQCNTLIVDVRPWALIINHSGTEILLQEGETLENVWYIPSDVVFAPPKLDNFFAFGVVGGEDNIFCSPLQLAKEERWYTLKFEGRIPNCGATNISIPLKDKVCFITILSRFEENIQVLHLVPTYAISNCTSETFQIRPMQMQAMSEKMSSPKVTRSIVLEPSDSSAELKEVSLLFWDIINKEFSSCVLEEVITLQIGRNGMFCHPISFPKVDTDLRVSFTLPSSATSKIINSPYLLTVHPHNTQVKFVIQSDPSPQMVVYNNTWSILVFGQCSLQEEGLIEEETNVFCSLPSVPPSKCVFYSFPNQSSKFPDIFHDQNKIPKLHLSQPDILDNAENEDILWSQGVDINQNYDQFVSVPGFGDVKIHIEKVGHTSHVFVDPASRIEISAKDIRSRISSIQTSRSRVGTPGSNTSNNGLRNSANDSELDSNSSSIDFPSDPHRRKSIKDIVVIYFTFVSSQFSLVIKDDLSCHSSILEVLRISFDNLIVSLRPKLEFSERLRFMNCGFKEQVEFIVFVGDAQIDNQLHAGGKYDFPVILVRQEPNSLPLISSFEPIERIIQDSYNEALFSLSLLLERCSNRFCVQTMNVRIKPINFFIEDAIIYSLSDFFKSFLLESSIESNILLRDEDDDDKSSIIMKLSSDILTKSYAMTHPIHIGVLKIEPISLLLSVHASAKLYLALDQSPLHFQEYQRNEVMTTGYSLGHNMAIHYLSSALLRAGWVVSSLDLLGNPGGFARTVGSGIRDFVQLPYRGILQGPWAFIAGITNGSLSLVKHFTAGTLVSITNLASSVARNMERLSLDKDHSIRNEANRRIKPSGLTNGVVQGLSSFGVSILGAIGGLIHHPMQAVLTDGMNPSSVVGGIGRGLMGIVTKPIGGAADFVVHAGQGLLQGAGWQFDLTPRTPSRKESYGDVSNSPLKLIWKLLVALPKECRQIICAVDATLLTLAGTFSPVTVLLTPQVLFILGVEEDALQQAFSLHELEWKEHSLDPTLLFLEKVTPPLKVVNEEIEPISGCPERVADYVRSTCSEDVGAEDVTSEEESSDLRFRVKLYLSPHLRTFLISSVSIAVKAIKGKGFIT